MAYYQYPYIPQYQNPIQPQQAQPVSVGGMNNSIIWVQGEAGAKSYLVAPNNTVQLWDSEQQTIYLKSADASGMPSMRILDYTIRTEGSKMPHNALNNTEPINVCRDDLNALQGQIDALKSDLEHCKELIAKGADYDGRKSALSADAG